MIPGPLLTYRTLDGDHLGIVDDDRLLPILDSSPLEATTTVEELRHLRPNVALAQPLDDVVVLPSSPRASKIIGVGANYHSANPDPKPYPTLFAKFASGLVGPSDDIVLPAGVDELVYEGEIAVVIGSPGRRIARQDALDHVLGLTIANDVTARDYQRRTSQFLPGKAWDRTTPLGPHITPLGSVDLTALRIRTTLNGDLVQDGGVDEMIESIPSLIAIISEMTELRMGDVILTGTPAVLPGARHRLVDGDLVEVSVEGLGSIRNRVRAERR